MSQPGAAASLSPKVGRSRPDPPWLLVFDLDGTLIDSSQDLCRSVNAALTSVNKHPLPEEAVTRFVGDGAATLVRRALLAASNASGDSISPQALQAEFEKAFPFFLSYYREHKLDTTSVYPGVQESLARIRGRHPELPMAVLTNKPVNPSREICAALGLAPYFFAIYGGNSFRTKKPEPAGLLAIMAEARARTRSGDGCREFPAQGVVMIGDSHVDVLTARACGAQALGCRYGLAPEALLAAQPDWIVESAMEWPDALGL